MSPKGDIAAPFVAGRPHAPFDLRGVLQRAYQAPAKNWRMRFGFAYATESGLDVLLDVLEEFESWDKTHKMWILGLHQGITEPSAIERVRSLLNSQVRLFAGGQKLIRESLLTGPRFHAKVICVDRGSDHRVTCVLASSANLTGAAFGHSPRNYEAGIALYPDLQASTTISTFDEWWNDAWDTSIDVSDPLLEKYIRLRNLFLRQNPDVLTSFDPPSVQQINNASFLWIEAGAMSGGSRNQVEFNRELADFFGPVSVSSRDLPIAAQGQIWHDRPLSPKTTTFGVDIWRLSLPTHAQGGFEYPGRVIGFKKRQGAHGLFFDLDVSDLDSRKHRRWLAVTHRRGYLGVTSGNRAYGFS